MNCPVCKDTKLVIADRQGVEIDYCPNCRGVWLDRGELDKIIERASPAQQYREPEKPRYSEPEQFRHKDDDHYKYEYKKKKKGGFLEDIFDF